MSGSSTPLPSFSLTLEPGLWPLEFLLTSQSGMMIAFFSFLFKNCSQVISTYKDESDYFYDNPYEFMEQRFSSGWPSHIALFEALLSASGPGSNKVSSLLQDHNYIVQQSFWNSLFHLDHRRRGRILLLTNQSFNLTQTSSSSLL